MTFNKLSSDVYRYPYHELVINNKKQSGNSAIACIDSHVCCR